MASPEQYSWETVPIIFSGPDWHPNPEVRLARVAMTSPGYEFPFEQTAKFRIPKDSETQELEPNNDFAISLIARAQEADNGVGQITEMLGVLGGISIRESGLKIIRRSNFKTDGMTLFLVSHPDRLQATLDGIEYRIREAKPSILGNFEIKKPGPLADTGPPISEAFIDRSKTETPPKDTRKRLKREPAPEPESPKRRRRYPKVPVGGLKPAVPSPKITDDAKRTLSRGVITDPNFEKTLRTDPEVVKRGFY